MCKKWCKEWGLVTLSPFFLPILLLTGCGYIGPVLPPLLDIPSAIPYVNAIEYGNKIVVQFTLPDTTTEGNALHDVRLLDVRVGLAVTPFTTESWAKTAKSYPVPNPAPGPYTREIPASEWIGKEVFLSVRATGPRGKASQWATVKVLKIEPPLPKPADLKAANDEAGVKLTWTGSAPKYRIFRAISGATPERLEDSERPEITDQTSEYGKTYQYLVQAMTDELHTSEVATAPEVTTKDTFPPAVPGALTAILGAGTVELAWTRSTEKDFRGYNVYRSTDGGPLVKIAELIPAPSFSDNKIEPGKRYRYEVSAVDTAGNESPHSTPADASQQ